MFPPSDTASTPDLTVPATEPGVDGASSRGVAAEEVPSVPEEAGETGVTSEPRDAEKVFLQGRALRYGEGDYTKRQPKE